MEDLIKKFDGLGYDLIDLDNVVYLSADIDPDPPKNCGDHCITCSVSCKICGAGCPTGTTK